MSSKELDGPQIMQHQVHGGSELASSSPVPGFDAAKYSGELEALDLTTEQKVELLETLWSIMASFVRLGFDVKICEQIFEAADILPGDACGDVKCSDASRTEKKTGDDGLREGRHDER